MDRDVGSRTKDILPKTSHLAQVHVELEKMYFSQRIDGRISKGTPTLNWDALKLGKFYLKSANFSY